MQKRYRYAILVSTGIYILQQFSGINVVVYFSGNIFNQMGFSKSESLLARYLLCRGGGNGVEREPDPLTKSKPM